MNKKYGDSAKSAAAKFITVNQEDQTTEPAKELETTAEPKKKRGRPKKTDQKPQNVPEATAAAKVKKNPAKKTKADTAAQKKPQEEPEEKTAFSIWATRTDIERWKTYCKASGLSAGAFGKAAFDEYMKRHKLTAASKEELKKLIDEL